MFVDKMTFRSYFPAGTNTLFCSCDVIDECKGIIFNLQENGKIETMFDYKWPKIFFFNNLSSKQPKEKECNPKTENSLSFQIKFFSLTFSCELSLAKVVLVQGKWQNIPEDPQKSIKV